MLKRTKTINLTIPEELLKLLENSVDQKKFPDVSKAIRGYTKLGIKLELLRSSIKDPEILKLIDEFIPSKQYFDWLESLSNSEKEAIVTGVEMERTKF